MNKPLRVCSARWSYFYGQRRFLGTVLGCAALADTRYRVSVGLLIRLGIDGTAFILSGRNWLGNTDCLCQ